MVLFSLAAGSTIGGGLSNVYLYNRESWMTDVQLIQNRRNQQQTVRLAQHEMFREDIRDLVQSSVSKQGNFVLIATLVLGMTADCYSQAVVPDASAEFVVTCYTLCLGSALVYVLVAIICAVCASHKAADCQKELLTTLVRLPVQEFADEIEESAVVDAVNAFEQRSVHELFRIPGISRFSTSDDRPDINRAHAQATGSGSTTKQQVAPRTLGHPDDGKFGERHFAVYACKERQWAELSSVAFLFGCFGISHLVQAYGYFALSKYYNGEAWNSLIVQLLLVCVDAGLGLTIWEQISWVGVLGSISNVIGPLSASVAVRIDDKTWDSVTVLLCYACHVLWNVVCLGKLLILQRLHEKVQAECDLHQQNADAAFADCVSPRFPMQQERLTTKVNLPKHELPSGRWACRSAVVLVCMAWLATLIWAITKAEAGHADNGIQPNLSDRRLRAFSKANQENNTTINADLQTTMLWSTWPSPFFKPRALGCSGKRCFIASNYLIYELILNTSGNSIEVEGFASVNCRPGGSIIDLTPHCTSSHHCDVLVLVEQSHSAKAIVNCSSGNSLELQSTVDQTKLLKVLPASPQSQFGLVTLGGSDIIEWAQSSIDFTWFPRWSMFDLDRLSTTASDSIVSAIEFVRIDVFTTRSILMQRVHDLNSIKVLHLEMGLLCREYFVPSSSGLLVSGAMITEQASHDTGSSVRLLLLLRQTQRESEKDRFCLHSFEFPSKWQSC